MITRAVAAFVALAAIPPVPHAVKPPSARVVAQVFAAALAHREQTDHSHYRFYDARCEAIIVGKRWACTVRARSMPGHLILFPRVDYTPHVGFAFGKADVL